MTRTKKQSTEAAVREIRRKTRRKFAPEEKVRIVLEGLRGEQSTSELCRREGIASNLYYRWSKDFLEAGKKQLAGDTVREATSDEVKDLRAENRELKEVVAEVTLKNPVLKKKSDGSWRGGRHVRRTASEKMEIIRLVEETDLSLRELACRYTDERRYFVSESSVYRILNWGWYYLSTVLEDFSRYIIAWKLSSTMGATDVTETLDEALAITGVDQIQVKHRPRLLSDNGSAYVSGELRDYLKEREMTHTRGAPTTRRRRARSSAITGP